jgi:molybdopterin molybdotransferase
LFFKVKTSEEVLKILEGFDSVGEENSSIDDALGRVISRDIRSPENLPGFYRSSVDGYAVKAEDTFGATESLPGLLDVSAEVTMGEPPVGGCASGKAVKIPTGGMLPEGADGVVMLEYCHELDKETIEVTRAISPLENVIRPDDDFKQGGIVFRKGSSLRSQDLGLLAGLGIIDVQVYRRPRVAIISTGDEIIPIDKKPVAGQVRDINSHTLGAFCRHAGAIPITLGLCGDDFTQLRDKVVRGLDMADTVWISGGSSVGTRDLTLKVCESFREMELLVHGISISPGKPTIIARIGSRAVFGLPGHAVSTMVIAQVFLKPFLSRLSGRNDFRAASGFHVNAELSRNIESASGRDDYIRVKLDHKGDKIIAEPIFGKSGLISTLVEAHGLVRVDRNTEGLYQGQVVRVILFASL